MALADLECTYDCATADIVRDMIEMILYITGGSYEAHKET